jgi:hypothetical protein
VTPAEAAKYFFQGAMSIWLGAPDFKGSPSSRSLNEWFDVSLRENLPVIERKRGADAYIGVLRSKVEEAYQNYARGEKEAGTRSMLELLDLIHTHLHLPSKKQIDELVEDSKHRQ